MRSVMENVREADAHSIKLWTAGPTTSNQYTLGYDVAA